MPQAVADVFAFLHFVFAIDQCNRTKLRVDKCVRYFAGLCGQKVLNRAFRVVCKPRVLGAERANFRRPFRFEVKQIVRLRCEQAAFVVLDAGLPGLAQFALLLAQFHFGLGAWGVPGLGVFSAGD